MDNKVVNRKRLVIEVGLDEKNRPETLAWTADDSISDGLLPTKAFLLSLFDAEQRETLRIDLWTNDLQVVEMDRLMYHSLRGMADTYFKSTKNDKLANAMQQFAQYFGEQTGIIMPDQTAEEEG